MGQGGIGGNGSVYWEFVQHGAGGDEEDVDVSVGNPDNPNGKKHALGHDPIKNPDIGTRPNGQDLSPGHFKLTLIYPTAADASTALANAYLIGSRLVLHVPANPRNNRPRLNQMEIQVDW